jgi:hypothetical protein
MYASYKESANTAYHGWCARPCPHLPPFVKHHQRLNTWQTPTPTSPKEYIEMSGPRTTGNKSNLPTGATDARESKFKHWHLCWSQSLAFVQPTVYPFHTPQHNSGESLGHHPAGMIPFCLQPQFGKPQYWQRNANQDQISYLFEFEEG